MIYISVPYRGIILSNKKSQAWLLLLIMISVPYRGIFLSNRWTFWASVFPRSLPSPIGELFSLMRKMEPELVELELLPSPIGELFSLIGKKTSINQFFIASVPYRGIILSNSSIPSFDRCMEFTSSVPYRGIILSNKLEYQVSTVRQYFRPLSGNYSL